MHRIIKMEDEEYSLHEHYNPVLFNHCMNTFHDQDSNQDIIHTKCSTHEVLTYLTQTMDICDTPLNDIINFVQNQDMFRGVDLQLVKRKVIKQKNILKRNRAKNRKFVQKTVLNDININNFSGQKAEEYKKQRNRISAQISRDRKKEKVKQLQDKNKTLKEEYQKMKAENQKLKEQLRDNKSIPAQPYKNRLNKLLILLGLICLFGIIKDFFLPQSKKVEQKIEIKHFQEYTSESSEEQPLDFTEQERNQVYSNLEAPLGDIFQSTTLVSLIKNKIQDKNFQSHKLWGSMFTSKGRQELFRAKEIALSL